MDDFDMDVERGKGPGLKGKWPLVIGIFIILFCLVAVAFLTWHAGWLRDLNLFSGSSTPAEISITPTGSSGGVIGRQYEWSYGGREWSLRINIARALYDYCSTIKRAPVEDYSIYVTHPLDDDLVATIAAELRNQAEKQRYDPEETVNFAARFVQSLAYVPERDEYPRYPVETLVNKGGDCEDTSILMAALLQAMGYDAVLLRFSPPDRGEPGHMAVGVAVAEVSGGHGYKVDGRTYYYLETTAQWPLGEVPPDIVSKFRGKTDDIYRLVAKPALKFTSYSSYLQKKWFGEDTLDLKITVTNWGTANAEAFYIRAFFEGYESSVKVSTLHDLKYGYQLSGIAIDNIVVPDRGGYLHLELIHGGVKVDEWTEYFS